MEYNFTRSIFTGLSVLNPIKKDTKVVFVSDFFKEDLIGGAELTFEAIIKKCPYSFVKLKASELSPKIIEENKNVHWVIGNFATISPLSIDCFLKMDNVVFSIVEFDFKYCIYRSPIKHFMQTQEPCNCSDMPHGKAIESLYGRARNVFWMSEKQRDLFFLALPNLKTKTNHVVQSSTFEDEDLEYLLQLKEQNKDSEDKKNKVWAILNSNNPLKGMVETIKWANQKGLKTRLIGNLPYKRFLEELSKCHGLIFRATQEDTAPRITIEAKLMGLELELNNNVLHKNEEWFKGTFEQCLEFQKNRAVSFWNHVEVS